MLAPMIIGMEFFIVMRSAAAMVMMTEVLVEDDWTSTVAKMPSAKPVFHNNLSDSFVFPSRCLANQYLIEHYCLLCLDL